MSISDCTFGLLLAIAVLATAPALAADRSAVVMPVPGQPYFVQMAPIFVPVIDQHSISRQVSIAVAVEIADGAKAKDVDEKRPELNDAFLGDIYGYVQQRGGVGAPQGETALKQRLRDTAQRVLGEIAVKDVEIEEFFEQRR
jgi:flagellar basal body-associated protein FliL